MDCALCEISFQKSPELLDHMRFNHGIIQPYQCFGCLKRYASRTTLYNHRKFVCKYDSQIDKLPVYSIPSFISVSVDSWTATVGDRLECIQLDDHIVVEYDGKAVSFVPKKLVREFIEFLQQGKIYACVRGVPVKTRFGFQVPVDYTFVRDSSGKISCTPPQTPSTENEVPHTPSCIPTSRKKKYPQRRCVGCRSQGIRRDTRYYCIDCNTALCKDCFKPYHVNYII